MCIYSECPMIADGLSADCQKCPYADGSETEWTAKEWEEFRKVEDTALDSWQNGHDFQWAEE